MVGFISAVGFMTMSKALLHAHGLGAVFLGVVVLLSVIAAEATKPWLDLTHHSAEFPGDASTLMGSLPSALPALDVVPSGKSHQPSALSPVPALNHGARTASLVHVHWGHAPSPTFTPSGLHTRDVQPLSTPRLDLPDPGLGFSVPSNFVKRPIADSPVFLTSQLPLDSNISSAPSVFSSLKTPHLLLNSDQMTLEEPPFSPGGQQERGSQHMPVRTTSLDPPKWSSSHFVFDPKLSVKASAKTLDVNRPHSAPLQESNSSQGFHMLPTPALTLTSSSSVPFFSPTSPSAESTELFPEDFFPTNTMDIDWGSGDYLETMSFLGSEGDDYTLVTKLPSDMYDLEDVTERYDTSFPSRVGVSPSSLQPLPASLPSSSTSALHRTAIPLTTTSYLPTIHYTLEPTPTGHGDTADASDVDWSDSLSIEPTDVLLPDMNSLEYYTTQLSKENVSKDTGAEHKGVVSVSQYVSVEPLSAKHIAPTSSYHVQPSSMLTVAFGGEASRHNDNETKWFEGNASGDVSGFEPSDVTATIPTTDQNLPINTSELFVFASLEPSPFFELSSSSSRTGPMSTRDWTVALDTSAVVPSSASVQPDEDRFYSSLTDVHWFATESFLHTSIQTTATEPPTQPIDNTTAGTPTVTELMPNITAATPESTPNITAATPESTPNITAATPESTPNITAATPESTPNTTLVPPFMMGDEGTDGFSIPVTFTLIPASSEANTESVEPHTTSPTTTPPQATTTGAASTHHSFTSHTTGTVLTTVETSRQYLCNIDRPTYLIKIGFPSGATVGFAKSQVRDVLRAEFNKSIELQVVEPPPKFAFRVVSGSVVYTAISVISALRRSGRRFLSLSANWTIPGTKYQVHTVLQFVPSHIDIRVCNFSESLERGLTMAFAEMRQRTQDSSNFTVQILNITLAASKDQLQQLVREPVDITWTVRGSKGYLLGSEVSSVLMKFTVVEFSYYMGFPVLQIAEPFHYPELNTSQLLRSSWVRTVLLGVLDQKAGERTFQANMERRVATLLGEALGLIRRVKRATNVGNSSVQVVSTSRLEGADHPLAMVYFVEDPSGQRMPAVQTANLLNSLDVQRAAIVLGYPIEGVFAQPVEKLGSSPSDSDNTNTWIVVGVVIPLLVVIIIISILYWKLCRTDKLEFQPDAMTSIQQQRQKLQAPSVKGFDFAKLHLGQQSKDDIMVIQESGPAAPGAGSLPVSLKDGLSSSQNGELPTPASKTSASSTKASRSSRRRERILPSDGDSVVSDHSSERESNEDNLRSSDSKQTRKIPINVLNGPPPVTGTNEQLSSAAIFEHVDRMSRATEASKKQANKVQLIAMQPMQPGPPLPGPPINGKLSETNQINKEVQVALRQKSEIEHHRNKIRLRAKRRGHYDFPAMDDMVSDHGDAREQDHICHKAQMQIDKILDPECHMSSIIIEPKKCGRGRRSPKQRLKEQLNGGVMDADKDHLITDDNDAAYRKCPGVNNVAYVSDLDQGQGSPHRSPSPTDDVFLGPTSSPPDYAPPPPPYMPPQPSIEEARQQMHSLLDDAFALVSPTSQGSTAGITLPGVNSHPPGSSPPGRGPRPWGSSYQALGPFPRRYSELSLSPPAVQCLLPRQGLGSCYLSPGEMATHGEQLHGEQLHGDSLYCCRGFYTDDLPSSARPRPVGGATGLPLHHLTQVGLSTRMNGYPAGVRAAPGQNGGPCWNRYHDNTFSQVEPEKDAVTRSAVREASAPPPHLDTPGLGYLSAHTQPLDSAPPPQSSASLIKAIREELLRLSQKQAAVSSYHS